MPKGKLCDRINNVVRHIASKRRRVGMADEADSKSVVGNNVRVQVPLPAVLKIAETPVKSRGSAFFLLKLF